MKSINTPTHSIEYNLVVLNGPDKGTTYKLISGRLTIGRGSENDISLAKDSKVSRQHAWITVTPNGVEIRDVSDKNKIFIDGHIFTHTLLKDQSVIQIGETRLQFLVSQNTLALNSMNPEKLRRSAISKSQSKSYNIQNWFLENKKSAVFIALCLLFGGYYLTSQRPSSTTLSSSQQPLIEEEKSRELAAIESATAQAQAEHRRRGLDSPNALEIQTHFIRGFRDLSKGNYLRARESFQACLALQPDHERCIKYSNDASRLFWSLVDNEMLRGLQHRDKNQFVACAAAFNNVKNLVIDQTHKKFIEAETNRRFCEERARDRY